MGNFLLAGRHVRPFAFSAITLQWHRLLALLAILLSSSAAGAQTITIPTANTNTGSVRFPLASWFGYERTALLYTSGEISASGTITSVGFYLNSVSSPGISPTRILMKTTSANTLTASTVATEETGATLVYNATIPAASFVAGQWITLTLSTPFAYTGANNLEIIVETNATNGGSGEGSTGKQFRYSTATGRSQTWAADNTAPAGSGSISANRPNVQLAGLAPLACAPPSGLAVGSITGNSASVSFTAGNGNTSYVVTYTPTGGATATVAPNPTASPVSLMGLTPGTTYTVTVTGNCAGSTTSTAATTTFTTIPVPPDYVISRSTGVSYSSIQATGTSFTGWSSTSSTDDNVSGSTPIGFNFQYFGQALTSFRVSTNGWVTLNTTQIPSGTDNYNNNLGNANANTILAPFWEDLVLQGNAGTATALAAAKIKYQLDGTAPNRVLTVEWAEMETFNNAGPNLNFQLKLYETTNEIGYVYGNMSGFDGSADYTYSYSLGLSGALASTGQYLAQQVPNTTYFLNSNAGTANSGANALNITPSCNSSLRFVPGSFVAGTAPTATAPANDEPANATALALGTTAPTDFCSIYTSANATATTGIAACTATTPGTPDDDVWFSFTLPVTSNITVTLRNSGGYDGVLQLFSGTPGSLTAVACSNATSTGLTENYTNATLAAATYYVRVYHAGTGSGTNGTFVLAAYATPAPPVNDECVGAIGLTSAPTTCTPLAGTTLGATATAGVTACSATTPGTADDDVWYKFTASGSVGTLTVQSASGFDAVLQLYSGACGTLTSLGCINGTSTGGAEVGSLTGLTANQVYYARVYHAGSGSGSGNFTICLVQPTCTDPSNLTTTNITTTTADLTFTAGNGATSYIVTYTPQGGATTTFTPAPTASPVQFTGLTSGTLYAVTLQQNCTGGQQSAVLTTSFTTLAPPPANDDCSNAVVLTSATTCTATSGTVAGATQSLAPILCGNFTGTAPAQDVWYQFTATGTTHTITVTGTFDGVLEVLSGACGSTTNVGCSDVSGNNETLTLTTLTGGTVYRLRYYPYLANPTNKTFTICVTEPAACPAPTALATNSITTTSANVTFTASAASYTVTYTPAGGSASTVTPAPTASPVALNGLTPSTAYTVSIVANCTGTTTSTAATTTFTTLGPPPANDECSTATAITSIGTGTCGTAVNGTNVGATTSSTTGTPAPGCASYAGGDVWFSLTVPANGIVQVQTDQGSGTSLSDTGLALYSGTCGNLTLLGCDDDAGNGAFSLVNATGLTPGSTIYARVWDYDNDDQGTFTICASTTASDLIVSTPQNVTGTYNNVTVQSGGIATLTGPLTVNGTLTVQSGGILDQNCQPLNGLGSFTLQTGGELRICDAAGIATTGSTGAVQVTGTRTYASDASYTYNGTAAQVTGIGLPGTVRNLTVNNPNALTLSKSVSIDQVARLQNGNLATGGFSFTLLSSAAGTALIDNTGGVVTGTGTMQRAITNAVTGPAYRHFSSPVQSTTLADLTTTGFAPTFNTAYNNSATPSLVTPFPTVFGYDQSRLATVTSTYGAFDKGWFSPAGSGDVMQPNRGYTANAPATATPIDFVGTFNNAAQNSGTLSRGTDAAAGWQLLGNPYPAPLDWSTVGAGQRPGMDGAMYVYQSTGQYAGTYRSYDNGVGASPLIDAGSGYFARVTTPAGSGAVNLANTNRVTVFGAQPAFGRGTTDTRPQLHLQLAGAGLADDTYLYLEQGATAGVDAQYDATKLANPAGLDLASLSGTTPLAINGLAPLTTTDVVVPLTLRVPQAGSFSFEVGDLANFGAATVYLRDALTGTQLLLASGTRYQFALATATAGTGRFSVVFRAATVTANKAELNAASVSLYPNPSHGSFTVLLPPLAGQREVRATLVNALGQVVLTRTIGLTAAGATAEFNTRPLATGVYTLKLQAENQALTKRVVVE